MKAHLACALLSLTLIPIITSTSAWGQNTGVYCTAGNRPDGYIDLTQLPPSPTFPTPPGGGSPSPSSPITVTLPVTGIAGLTVEATIPSIQPTFGTGPVYSVTNGALQLNGLSTASYDVMLQFNNPVVGVSMVGQRRRARDWFSITTDLASLEPAKFVNSNSMFNEAASLFQRTAAAGKCA